MLPPAYTLTGALIDMSPVKLAMVEGKEALHLNPRAVLQHLPRRRLLVGRHCCARDNRHLTPDTAPFFLPPRELTPPYRRTTAFACCEFPRQRANSSPLVDDRPMMNAVKYRVVSGVAWSNRTTASSNTDTNRTAVSLLASHQGDPGSISGRVTPDLRMWESCRTTPLVGGFSRGFPVSLALSFSAAPYSLQSLSSTLDSQDLDVESRPKLSTYFLFDVYVTWRCRVLLEGVIVIWVELVKRQQKRQTYRTTKPRKIKCLPCHNVGTFIGPVPEVVAVDKNRSRLLNMARDQLEQKNRPSDDVAGSESHHSQFAVLRPILPAEQLVSPGVGRKAICLPRASEHVLSDLSQESEQSLKAIGLVPSCPEFRRCCTDAGYYGERHSDLLGSSILGGVTTEECLLSNATYSRRMLQSALLPGW
ncbi:hypothetical protein PR048_003635 [Dryococelus australis]|uniref:Uncharacterized protein n=1 Tax=Dryococelus australis TaxID=614101 RepID=A0ABQ9INQ0_9NEOP|nr:hypothetical protein PR048_003635 [Dryococelus australis]